MDPSIQTKPLQETTTDSNIEWTANLESTREQLKKAEKRLQRYRAALRLANVEIERRNRGIITLMTFAYQANRTATPSTLLKLALVQALEAIDAPTGATVLIDKDTNMLTLGIHKGLTPELKDILTGKDLEHGATALMPHLVAGSGALLESKTSTDELERQLLTASRLTSLVSLPLQLGPRLMGAFIIGLRGKKTFTPAELCFLMALSQETAIALESLNLRDGLWHTAEAFLGQEISSLDLGDVTEEDVGPPPATIPTPFDLPGTTADVLEPAEDDLEQLLAAMMEAEDEVQQQNTDLQTLITIAKQMNRTLNLKEILQCAVDQTKNILNKDATWVYLMNENRQLSLGAHTGLSKHYAQAMGRLALSDGVEGKAVLENQSYFVDDINKAGIPHKIWVDKEGIHGLAVVPVTRPGAQKQAGESKSYVIGVLAAATIKESSHTWTPRETRLLTSVANQIALAIDNAQLYEKLQEKEAGLRAGNEVLQNINDMLLEKNSFLEGLIQDDLIPALTDSSPIFQRLLNEDNEDNLSASQKEDLKTLQQTFNKLNHLTKEAGMVSRTLDEEVDQVFQDDEAIEKGFAGPTKPIRLEKKLDNGSQPPKNSVSPVQETILSEATKTVEQEKETTATVTKVQDAASPGPMSFEDAVKAGLVPSDILKREEDS